MSQTLMDAKQPNGNANRAPVSPHVIARAPRPRDGRAPGADSFTKGSVAELSMAEIETMSSEELIAVIRAADLPLLHEETIRRLQFFDQKTLQRLAFLARRVVQNQGY